LLPARVIREDRRAYLVQTDTSLTYAELSGKLGFDTDSSDRPKVGDWVLGSQETEALFVIKQGLPRKNKISRKVAGNRIEEQVLAANIDLVVIVMGLDHDFNMNRLERFLALGKQREAEAVIVLNKTDVCPDLDHARQQVEAHSQGQKILMVSAASNTGITEISDLFKPSKTGVLIGSSGVGKSTIINRLLGTDTQATKEVREDDSKGSHTTSFRQLFLLPNGGSLIDTPGMRELSLWEEKEEEFSSAFQDIFDLAMSCKFSNCTHAGEKECAVQAAISDSTLDEKRYANFLKIQKEKDYLQSQISDKSKYEQRKKQKKLHAGYKKKIKGKNKGAGKK